MDPIALATLTSAVTVLATETAKGVAGEAGKDLWTKVKSLLGFKIEPPPAELAERIARRILEDPALAERLRSLLTTADAGSAAALVGTIHADKVVVADKIDHVKM